MNYSIYKKIISFCIVMVLSLNGIAVSANSYSQNTNDKEYTVFRTVPIENNNAIIGASKKKKIYCYECYLERGINHLIYCKTTVSWTTENNKKIKKVYTNQTPRGFLVEAKGVKENKARSKNRNKNRYYNSKTKLVAGVEYKGITIGYSSTCIDEIHIDCKGNSSVRENI